MSLDNRLIWSADERTRSWPGSLSLSCLILHSGDEYGEVIALLGPVVERIEAIEDLGRRKPG